MTKEEYGYITSVDKEQRDLITAQNLKDKSDRTLLYGYTCNRDTWHVYLKDGQIHTVQYTACYVPGKTKLIPCSNDMVERTTLCNRDYIPDKRVYPEYSDFEFCLLLKKNLVDIPFTNIGSIVKTDCVTLGLR